MKKIVIMSSLLLAACSSNHQEEIDFSMIKGSWYVDQPSLCSIAYRKNIQSCREVAEQRFHEEKIKNIALAKNIREKLTISNSKMEVIVLNGVSVNDKGELVPYGNFSLQNITPYTNIEGNKDSVFLYSHNRFPYYIVAFNSDLNLNTKTTHYNTKLKVSIKCGLLSEEMDILNKPSYLVTPLPCD